MKLNLPIRRIACLIVLAAMGFACEGSNPEVPRISLDEAFRLHRDSEAIFVDVRTGRTWETSAVKILKAVRQDPEAVEQWAGQYAKETILIFYCT